MAGKGERNQSGWEKPGVAMETGSYQLSDFPLPPPSFSSSSISPSLRPTHSLFSPPFFSRFPHDRSTFARSVHLGHALLSLYLTLSSIRWLHSPPPTRSPRYRLQVAQVNAKLRKIPKRRRSWRSGMLREAELERIPTFHQIIPTNT